MCAGKLDNEVDLTKDEEVIEITEMCQSCIIVVKRLELTFLG